MTAPDAFEEWYRTYNPPTDPRPWIDCEAAWLASRKAALEEAARAVPLPDRYGDNEFICAGRRDMWSTYQAAIRALIVDNPTDEVVNQQAKG